MQLRIQPRVVQRVARPLRVYGVTLLAPVPPVRWVWSQMVHLPQVGHGRWSGLTIDSASSLSSREVCRRAWVMTDRAALAGLPGTLPPPCRSCRKCLRPRQLPPSAKRAAEVMATASAWQRPTAGEEGRGEAEAGWDGVVAEEVSFGKGSAAWFTRNVSVCMCVRGRLTDRGSDVRRLVWCRRLECPCSLLLPNCDGRTDGRGCLEAITP